MNHKILGIVITIPLLMTVIPVVGFPMQTEEMNTANFEQRQITTAAMNDIIISMLEQIDETIVLSYLENITSFGPRVMGTDACKESATYIYNTFQSLGLTVRYDNFSLSGIENNGTNIEATLEGVDTSTDEIYIICGHYDSVAASVGADDNAISIAAILSIATIMKQYMFNHTIRFIAFDAEEGGLLGSWHYVQTVYENGDNIKAVLNADMIGNTDSDEGTRKVTIHNNDQSEWFFNYASELNQNYFNYIHLQLINGGISGGSDHVPFWSGGYTTIYFEEFEFSPNWHKHSDTIENVNVAYATNVSKIILATLAESAELHENTPPKTSNPLVGPTQGKPGVEYSYSSSAIDSEEDQIYYWFDWGDGTTSGWLEGYDSGVECTANHTWAAKGPYTIRMKAKDIHEAESEWVTLTVTMPYLFNKPIYHVLQLLFQRLPNISLLLR